MIFTKRSLQKSVRLGVPFFVRHLSAFHTTEYRLEKMYRVLMQMAKTQ